MITDFLIFILVELAIVGGVLISILFKEVKSLEKEIWDLRRTMYENEKKSEKLGARFN